jgi:hypothetical protein
MPRPPCGRSAEKDIAGQPHILQALKAAHDEFYNAHVPAGLAVYEPDKPRSINREL